MTIRISLLGDFRLTGPNAPVRLPTHKAEWLLAYLALHPGPQPREKLAALLWGDFPDAQARASLRNALTAVRKALGPTHLIADRETIQLIAGPEVWVDVAEFTAQATAFLTTTQPAPDAVDLQLYAGDLLADCYAEWVVAGRESLRRLYLATLDRLAQLYRTRGAHRQALAIAHQLLAAEPTAEAGHRSVMLSLAALGDVPAALRQYDTCQQVLHAELGVAPSAETQALSERLRRQGHPPPAATAAFDNLPEPVTSFVGRQTEIEAITTHLRNPAASERLLTLTGPGGAGKTRLALQAARELRLAAGFEDGIWWVDLAPITDPASVPGAVAQALGLQPPPGPPQALSEAWRVFLHPRRLLVILDNCEHLVVACAQLAALMLQAGPGVRVLATSREALGLAGETLRPVAPLEIASEAAPLFAERAAALLPGFRLTAANAQAIAQICRRLDGMPLAIELAAARVKVLSPEQIAARLDDRFNLLTIGNRAALPRQQTLRAAMDWSYDLLEEAEQALLRRLSVFAGGCPLEGAAAVGGLAAADSNTGALIEGLGRLIDKSLLVAESPRYRLLETIREYAADKLWLAGEEPETRRRHLRWCVSLAEDIEPRLIRAEQAEWQARLARDDANLRAALQWAATGDAADVVWGLRLAGALWRFWDQRGYLGESRRHLEALLAQPAAHPPTAARAKALLHAGILAHYQLDRAAAETHLGESLAIWRTLGGETRWLEALTHHHLGFAAHRVGDLAAARPHYAASLILWRALDDEWGLSETLSNLGMLARREGDLAHAQAYHAESLDLKRKIGDPRGVAFALWGLGQVALARGHHAEAYAGLSEALTIAHRLNDLWTAPYALEALALLAAAQAQPERAAMLFGAASAVRGRTGSPTAPVWSADYARALAEGAGILGAEALAAAQTAGAALSLDDAVAFALGGAP